VVRVTSISYLLSGGGSQTTKTKIMMYRTLLACLRNIVNFWSKMTMKYNGVNAELKVTEKALVFLKIGQADRRDSSMGNSISRTEGVDFL
jgi:hypothetical protein